eukprot:2750530-Alexandrium_andersonii.AAC.1
MAALHPAWSVLWQCPARPPLRSHRGVSRSLGPPEKRLRWAPELLFRGVREDGSRPGERGVGGAQETVPKLEQYHAVPCTSWGPPPSWTPILCTG